MPPRCTLLGALLGALLCAPAASHVHGVYTRQNALQILRRRAPIGAFGAHLLAQRSSVAAVRVACGALECPDAYAILQMRRAGAASMYVVRVRSARVHEVVAILSTETDTPLVAVERAAIWHRERNAGSPATLRLAPGVVDGGGGAELGM